MSESLVVEKILKDKGSIEMFFELWEISRKKEDPLIQKWKEYIEKTTRITRNVNSTEK